jgi:VWFA-related protein
MTGKLCKTRNDEATLTASDASHSRAVYEVGERNQMGRTKLSCVLLVAPLLLFGREAFQTTNAIPPNRTPLQSQDSRERIRVRTDLVVLSVTVRDRSGSLVSGLAQEDFHVFDDSIEQEIVGFSAEGLPLSLVILVDNDMNWKDGTEMTKSLGAVAGGLSAADEVMVCRYDMLFYPGEKFTSVSGNLIEALKATQSAATPLPQYIPQPLVTDKISTSGPPATSAPTYAGHRPSKAMDDALYSAAALLQGRGGDRRRVILLVSDGANEPKLNHQTHDEVLEFLLKRNVSVYSLAVGAEGPKRKSSDLADYAASTGGAIFYATKSGTMEELYSRITEQARHDYTITYTPAGNVKNTNFHVVKVTAASGLTTSTRSGYYTGDSGPLQ